MADIAKPLLGRPGWNAAVDAVIDKVNAHERDLLATASWWLGATDLGVQGGTPAGGSAGGSKYRIWGLRDAQADGLMGSVQLPPWVATVYVDLYWTNPGAATGDVRWRVSIDTSLPGGDLSASIGSIDIQTTAPAPAQDILTVTRVPGTFTVDRFANLRITRLGNDAADTLAGNASLIGVKFTVEALVPQ